MPTPRSSQDIAIESGTSKSREQKLKAKVSSNIEAVVRRDEIQQRIQEAEDGLDAKLVCKGQQYNATTEDVNRFMQSQKCTCQHPRVKGIVQCQFGCSCDIIRKTCSIDCSCEGLCIPNTFLHFPQIAVRVGLVGDELYAVEDIDAGRLAYVFTGVLKSVKQHMKDVKGKPPDLYTITARWQGEEAGLPSKAGNPTFVVDAFEEIAGFVNHSCDPNTEVFEMLAISFFINQISIGLNNYVMWTL